MFFIPQKETKPSFQEKMIGQDKALSKYYQLANLAVTAKDLHGVIENLIYCFIVIEQDRINLHNTHFYVQDHDDRNKLPPSFIAREGMIRLDSFLNCLSEMNAVKVFNNHFSKVTDWDAFYDSYPDIEKENMNEFICLIYKLKNLDLTKSDRTCLVWDNMLVPGYNKNPYLTLQLEAHPPTLAAVAQ